MAAYFLSYTTTVGSLTKTRREWLRAADDAAAIIAANAILADDRNSADGKLFSFGAEVILT